jgi:putative transposase
VSRIWVRNHHDGGWILAPWTHLKGRSAPFGEQAWDHARQVLARRGTDPVTETEIAAAVEALLDKAEGGPGGQKPSRQDKRVAGRTRAIAQDTSAVVAPAPQEAPGEPGDDTSAEQEQGPLAKVIPLGIFDPFEEAKKRW